MELNEESEKLFQEFYEKNIDELCQLSQKSPEEICEYIKNLTDLDLLRKGDCINHAMNMIMSRVYESPHPLDQFFTKLFALLLYFQDEFFKNRKHVDGNQDVFKSDTEA